MDISTLEWQDGEPVDAEKLQAMVEEIRAIRRDLIQLSIQDVRNDSVVANAGNRLKILTGTVRTPVNENAQVVQGEVKFTQGSFSPGNAPIVFAQLATTSRIRSFVSIAGLGGNADTAGGIHPSSEGFSYWVAHQVLPPNAEGEPQRLTMAYTNILHWIAIGY